MQRSWTTFCKRNERPARAAGTVETPGGRIFVGMGQARKPVMKKWNYYLTAAAMAAVCADRTSDYGVGRAGLRFSF
ncbi:MAG: hypothetical protein KGJ88_09430 [Verrucomicrobiota bacterium]|nr:hypothetical protein [Verrucomicrobiota bacterium]